MNSSLNIEINGVLITGRVDGIDNFVVTLRYQDEEGKIARGFSSELTFYDDGYDILKTALIDPAAGFAEKVNVKIWDGCCSKAVFEGFIFGDSIDWCEPDCYISANLREEDPAASCIQNKLIWDNTYGFLNNDYRGIKYCLINRPLFIHLIITYFSLLLREIVYIIAFVLTPVVAIVWVICKAVQLFANNLSCNGDLVNPAELWQLVQKIDDSLDTCGHYHPTPLVREYLDNACRVCGLTFSSSILNNPNSIYSTMAMMAAQVERGRYRNEGNKLIDANLPIETVETLMRDYLKPMFNADYRIANGQLVFERKDYFLASQTWIDAVDLLEKGLIVDNKICFNWIDKDRYSYGNYSYSMDASDYIGNEARSTYGDIVEWNNPYSSSQKGSYDLMINAGASRYNGDSFEKGPEVNAGNSGDLIMAQHTPFLYKFMLISPQSGQTLNRFENSYCNCNSGFPQDISDPSERFNYPLWFVEGCDNNLYSNFHYIDDPRRAGTTQYDFKFTFQFDCDIYNNFDFSKTISLIRKGQRVNGQVKELSVDFNRRTIQVTGITA